MHLINRKSLRSLTSQMLDVLMSQEGRQEASSVRVEELSERYLQLHGVLLNPCEYGFLSLSELLKSMPYLVEVSGTKRCSVSVVASPSPAAARFIFSSCTSVVPRARRRRRGLERLRWQRADQADSPLPVCPQRPGAAAHLPLQPDLPHRFPGSLQQVHRLLAGLALLRLHDHRRAAECHPSGVSHSSGVKLARNSLASGSF